MELTLRPDDWRRRRLANDYETLSNYRSTNEASEQRAAQPRAELRPEDG